MIQMILEFWKGLDEIQIQVGCKTLIRKRVIENNYYVFL